MAKSLKELLGLLKSKLRETFISSPENAHKFRLQHSIQLNALRTQLNLTSNSLLSYRKAIYQQGNSAEGEDYTHSMKGQPGSEPTKKALIDFIGKEEYVYAGQAGYIPVKGQFHYLTLKTDDELLGELRNAFKLGASFQQGSNGYIDRFTEHFKNGRGQDYRNTVYLTEMMLVIPIYKELINEIRYIFDVEMKKSKGDFSVINFGKERLLKFFPKNVAFGDNRIVNMLVGGVQEINIFLTKMQYSYSVNGGNNVSYKGELNVIVYDDFGVSEDDTIKTAFATSLGRYAIISMWILQHQRDYHPFRTIFSINIPVNGTI